MPILGTTCIWAAFIATIVAIGLYVGALREIKPERAGAWSRLARAAFFVAAALVLGAAATHATLLMTRRFDVAYVYHYSARALKGFYLFSTFWAGQEGSFLLWAFWTAVLGVFLSVKSGALMERRVMPIYASVLGFILLLLIVKSPFAPYAGAYTAGTTGSAASTQAWADTGLAGNMATLSQTHLNSSGTLTLNDQAAATSTSMMVNYTAGENLAALNTAVQNATSTFTSGAISLAVAANGDLTATAANEVTDTGSAAGNLAVFADNGGGATTLAGSIDPAQPTDGMGMNPLLENPWMVVHPPTLFLGFASLAIPFAFALAALIFGDWDHWFRRVWPWALFSFSVLGFGVMLGGYWAYETLGWGGFWGWDPVENGPLVPWLGMVAFLHSAQVQHVRGSLKKTTLFLGLVPFVAALYETFLTRTGILDKFSVHSFSTLGGVADNIILWGLLGTLSISLLYLAWRARRIVNESSAWENATSREFGMTLAILVLLACAVVTGIGMSAPLITQAGVDLHLIARQSSIDTDFYDRANFPFGVLLAVGMAIGPYLAWKATRGGQLANLSAAYMISVAGSLAFFAASVFLGHFRVQPAILVLFAACLFAVVGNGQILFRRLAGGKGAREPLRTAGGYLAHIGAALLLLGVVCLVTFTRKESPMLMQDHPVVLSDLPYTMTYTGMTSNLQDRNNKLKFLVQSADGKRSFTALMPCAVRDVEGQKELLARPAIFNQWWGDLYFAYKSGPDPLSPTPVHHFQIAEGQTVQMAGYKIAFAGFWVPPDVAAMVKQNQMPAVFPTTALLSVTTPAGRIVPLAPRYILNRVDPLANASPEVKLPRLPKEPNLDIAFEGMDADTHSATFYIRQDAPPITTFTIEASTRPGIGLVWLGVVLIAFGGLCSMRRRALENRLVPVPEPEPSGKRATARSRRREPAPAPKPAPAAMKGSR